MTVGFKEWGLVCGAMGHGMQSIILRKGGISEDEGSFAFKHREFYLIPSHFHEQAARLKFVDKLELLLPPAPEQDHIHYLAKIVDSRVLTDWERVAGLDPFHVWKEEVIRERFFRDDGHAIHLAVVRVYRLEHSWILPNDLHFSGCKSWFDLPDNPGHNMVPVLDDAAHDATLTALKSVLEKA